MGNWNFANILTNQASKTLLLLLRCFASFFKVPLILHSKNIKMRFYSQFTDSAPSVSAFGASRGPRSREPESVTNCNEYMTGTFVYIKLGYLQNFMKNKCSMKCL